MDTEFELEWQKSEDKDLTRLFCEKLSVSDVSTPFFSQLVTRLKHGSSYRGNNYTQIIWRENKNYFELFGGYSKPMKEIQGRQTVELARVAYPSLGY